MTKEVFVRLNGMQFSSDADRPEPVEVISRGTYAKKNGKHYIVYEEAVDESNQMVKNTVKIWIYRGFFVSLQWETGWR